MCDGDGNTEVVRVTFDTSVTSYEKILQEFWHVSGSRAVKRRPKAQYKSAIFVTSEQQVREALAALAAKEDELREEGDEGDVEVVTEVLPMGPWQGSFCLFVCLFISQYFLPPPRPFRHVHLQRMLTAEQALTTTTANQIQWCT